jgi:hypothetical protein
MVPHGGRWIPAAAARDQLNGDFVTMALLRQVSNISFGLVFSYQGCFTAQSGTGCGHCSRQPG